MVTPSSALIMLAASDLGDWCARPKYLLAHHKSGSVMVGQALNSLNGQLQSACHASGADDVRLVEFAAHGVNLTAHNALPESCFRPAGVDAALMSSAQTMRQVPVLAADALAVHILRHPVEMVVSSYAYDLDVAEPTWQRAPLGSCVQSVEATIPSEVRTILESCSVGQVASLHCAAIDAVVCATRGGGMLAGRLPAFDNETWAAYLSRLGEDEGLLAESVMMRHLALDNMVQTHESFGPWAEVRSESSVSAPLARAAVCESDFEDATLSECERLWRHVVTGLGFPADTAESAATEAAALSCPQGAEGRDAKARHGTATTNGTASSDRVARLLRLDAALHDGTLAAMAAGTPCSLSSRYRPTAAA